METLVQNQVCRFPRGFTVLLVDPLPYDLIRTASRKAGEFLILVTAPRRAHWEEGIAPSSDSIILRPLPLLTISVYLSILSVFSGARISIPGILPGTSNSILCILPGIYIHGDVLAALPVLERGPHKSCQQRLHIHAQGFSQAVGYLGYGVQDISRQL